MKLMKVIYKMRNMMIQEFQHSAECQWIEVMKMKMHMIQFDSIANLIQTREIELLCILQNNAQVMPWPIQESMLEEGTIFPNLESTWFPLNLNWQSSVESKAIWLEFEKYYLPDHGWMSPDRDPLSNYRPWRGGT
jgi:hypothetical protein